MYFLTNFNVNYPKNFVERNQIKKKINEKMNYSRVKLLNFRVDLLTPILFGQEIQYKEIMKKTSKKNLISLLSPVI